MDTLIDIASPRRMAPDETILSMIAPALERNPEVLDQLVKRSLEKGSDQTDSTPAPEPPGNPLSRPF